MLLPQPLACRSKQRRDARCLSSSDVSLAPVIFANALGVKRGFLRRISISSNHVFFGSGFTGLCLTLKATALSASPDLGHSLPLEGFDHS